MTIIERVMSDMKINEWISVESIKHNLIKESGYVQAMARFDEILTQKFQVPVNHESAHGSSDASSLVENTNSLSLHSLNAQKRGFDSDGNFDVRTLSSEESVSKINAYLKGTPMENMGEIFKHAEKRFGVNAYFLASIAVLESNFGRSAIARDKKNLFGFGAYDDNPYGHAHSYHSFGESVIKVADYLNKQYLTQGGAYYNGTTTADIGKRYATDRNWSNKINQVIRKMME